MTTVLHTPDDDTGNKHEKKAKVLQMDRSKTNAHKGNDLVVHCIVVM